MRTLRACLALAALVPMAGRVVAQEPMAAAVASARAPIDAAVLLNTYPHDPRAYTEGLFYRGGVLYESTGEVGRSTIRKVDLRTGRVMSRVTIPPPYFGEGIVSWRGQIISLTWKDGIGFRWSLDGFRKLGSFRYSGEGWGLTIDGNGDSASVIMSDGTATLRFLDPRTMQVRRTIKVLANGVPVDQLNELEFVDGEILANVWLTHRIARIDPRNGHVIGWIDLSALHARAGVTGEDQVANGIAWDAAGRRLFVTGKEWPYLFEIAPPKATRTKR